MSSIPTSSPDDARFDIAPLTQEVFEEALALWESTEGVVLRHEDHHLPAFVRFLDRNPKLNWGAWRDGKLIGAVMAGHDGRRGYIYHLTVAAECRQQGIGRTLVGRVEQELAQQGIQKAHAYVANRNLRAQFFWKKIGWSSRDDIAKFSRLIIEN